MKANPYLRKHIDMSRFPDRDGTRSCSVGGVPALCGTAVRGRLVMFSVRWRKFHEPGIVDCRGTEGIEPFCFEAKLWWVDKTATPRSFTWTFRLGPARRRIVGMRIYGGFPPWWVVHYRRVTLETFTLGTYGHTRGLHFRPDGTGREAISDGCCHLVADLDLRLTAPHRTPYGAAATVTLTRIRHLDRSAFTGRAPRVGDTGTVRLKNGVLTEPITGATYCGLNVAICGA